MSVSGEHLAPQRAQPLGDRYEAEGYLLEPEWEGRRALVRVGLGPPHFIGYRGAFEGPAELHRAIEADVRARSAVLDGVLVEGWEDEVDLQVDESGQDLARLQGARTIYMAFDLLEVDGQPLLDVPLLERKRHLEGVLLPSTNVRLTPFVLRGHESWGDSLKAQGFKRGVVKDLNSVYSAGQMTAAWRLIERLGTRV